MKRRRPATLEPIAASAFVIVSLHAALTAGLVWWWQNKQAHEQSAPAPLAWLSPADFKTALPSAAARGGSGKPAGSASSRKSTAQPAAEAAVPKAMLISPPPAPSVAEAPAAPAQPQPMVAEVPPAAAADPPKATLLARPPEPQRMEPAPNATPAAAPLFAPPTPAPKPSANRSITLRRTRTRQAAATDGKSPPPPMASPSLLDIARLNSMRPGSLPKPGTKPPATDDVDNNTALDPVDEALNAAFLATWTAPPIESVPPGQREARLNLSLGRDGTILKSQMSKFSGSHVLDQSILEAAANVKKIPVELPANYSKDSYDVELNFLLLP